MALWLAYTIVCLAGYISAFVTFGITFIYAKTNWWVLVGFIFCIVSVVVTIVSLTALLVACYPQLYPRGY